ncbi:unnamed protein product [Caenorhabditis nigoni]
MDSETSVESEFYNSKNTSFMEIDDSLSGLPPFPAPQLVCMTTSSLLTPPMDESEPTTGERHPDFYRQWERLPLLNHYEQERIRGLNPLLIDEFFCRVPREMSYPIRFFFAKARKYFVRYYTDMKVLYKKYKFPTMKRRIFFGMAKECHTVLLANDWTGALEIYQKLLAYDSEMFQRDPNMYFGLGLVYLHFKQWRPAIEAFSRVLYCSPTGRIALESKLRLGMCYMEIEDYHRCLNLFDHALNDLEESKFMPRIVIKFNIALCHENNEQLETAEAEYRKLQSDIDIFEKSHDQHIEPETIDLLLRLRAACLRQLGWINYRRTYRDEANRPEYMKKALDFLNQSNQMDPRDGQTYYYLGRVYGEQELGPGLVAGEAIEVASERAEANAHAAFVNYRQSIDKCEKNADTWCSIGALYLRKSQPMDALQAFISSVELNPNLTAAWTDLGELYERNTQYQDALDCFRKALESDPVSVSPECIKTRVNCLEKVDSLTCPPRPPGHVIPGTFDLTIPSLKDSYVQPIPLELRTRQDAQYAEGEVMYDNAFWDLWEDLRTVEFEVSEQIMNSQLEARPMEELEIDVLQLLRANEESLVKAEREVLECLETTEVLWKEKVIEAVVPEVCREMPRVTVEMIDHLRDHGHLIENPRCYPYPFLPKVVFNELPDSYSLLSEIFVSLDVPGSEIKQMIAKRAFHNNTTYVPIFDEFARLPELPKGPAKPIATDEDVKTALEKNERHPFMMKTPILTVDNRKEASSMELQRYLDNSTVACVRGLTGCLRLDLSMFSTRSVMEIDPNQEIEVRTQYHFAPETNCNHARKETWKCISDKSYTTLARYGQYQAESFRHTLRVEAEKIRRHGGNGGRGPSPKRMKLNRRAPSPPKELKKIKFGTNIDLSDEVKYGKHFSELSKLPAFCRLIAGSNLLSHLGHQIHGVNTVQLNMGVPGARISARQTPNHVALVNINIGPGDCEWFAVPYNYWGKMERLCEDRGIDFTQGIYWPIMEDLLKEGVPVHRFTQKSGDVVYVTGGTIYWMQTTGWSNNISWCVAPLNATQIKTSLLSYEWNKLRRVKSSIPMQLLCWQVAKNVKFTNQSTFAACKGVLIRSMTFLQIVHDYLTLNKKTIKVYPRGPAEASHFCRYCECEVFGILLVKEISNNFIVFCVYCAKSQGLEDFIALQQYTFDDLLAIYDNLKYVPASVLATNNNSKVAYLA